MDKYQRAKADLAGLLVKRDNFEISASEAHMKMQAIVDGLTHTERVLDAETFNKYNSDAHAKTEDDEPGFWLRGQDATAPAVVMEWVKLQVNNQNMPDDKIRDAVECALAMRNYRNRKFPD